MMLTGKKYGEIKAKMKLKRSEDWEKIKALHTLIFVDDDYEEADAGWILWDQHECPVGFCTARLLTFENGVFLTRAGILPGVRGRNLQRRMIHARERWAREQGREFVITYTSHDNYPSISNLLKAGYRFHSPEDAWAGREEMHYFLKEVKKTE